MLVLFKSSIVIIRESVTMNKETKDSANSTDREVDNIDYVGELSATVLFI